MTKEKIELVKQTTKSFRTCDNKGFHLRFKNGWIVSIQFGAGNYSDNYELIFKGNRMEMFEQKPDLESTTAEVWAWNKDKHYPEDPLGYQTIEQVMKFINKIMKKK